jgi:UDP-perosamine 4-acetyltransferase
MHPAHPIVLLGTGGHAKVVLDALLAMGRTVAGWAGPGPAEPWRGLPALGPDDGAWTEQPARYVVAIGIGENRARERVQDRLEGLGFTCHPIIHPHASLARDCAVAPGVQVMAGAVVQPDTTLGRGTIINTGARVDHDCRIGDFCHIAPGATLCGGVALGRAVLIGAGATVVPSVTIGAGAVIGAGATVVSSVAPGLTVTGTPARDRHA